VKRVNNGALGSKYSYLAMMAENAKSLESAAWREAAVPLQNVTLPVNKVSETDAVYDESGAMISPPSFSAFMSDGFDCYQQGGDARKETGTMCGYAGCVAYRFKIPAAAVSVALSSVALTIQRDRYCRAGVRVALVLSDSSAPSNDWSVVRGETEGAIVSESTASTVLGVSSWGFLSQKNVKNLVSGRAADSTITFNATGDDGFAALAETGRKYLWVYLTLEDYQSFWTMYNATDSRYYSIEGSAMLVASKSDFIFSEDVVSDSGSYHVADWACTGTQTVTNVGNAQAFGNFYKCGFRSILPITTRKKDGTNKIDIAIDKYGAKPFMSSPDWESGGYFPISDCDVIGGVPNTNANLLREVSCKIHNKFTQNALDESDALEAGKLPACTVVEFNYMPFRVPLKSISYNSTQIQGVDTAFEFKKIQLYASQHTSGNHLFNHVADMDVRLLLWRSRSETLDGTWDCAALAALASNPNFFTGGKRHITGTATGNGTITTSGGGSLDITNGVTIKADADLLQEVDCFKDLKGQEATYTGQLTMTIDLESPVKSNDILIIVPHLRMSHVDFVIDQSHIDQEQDYSWSMNGFDLRFLE
jgi:hypothetical protein